MAGWVRFYLCLPRSTTCKLQVESAWNYVCSLVLVHVSFHMEYLPDLEIHGHDFSKETCDIRKDLPTGSLFVCVQVGLCSM